MQYDLSTKTKSVYRIRGLNNLLRMGHCAPAVMQTVLGINHTQREDLVRLMAGMPGGIGNTGFECGVGVDGFNDFEEGDVLEFYKRERVS